MQDTSSTKAWSLSKAASLKGLNPPAEKPANASYVARWSGSERVWAGGTRAWLGVGGAANGGPLVVASRLLSGSVARGEGQGSQMEGTSRHTSTC